MPRRDAEREAQESLIRANNLAISRMQPPPPPPTPAELIARLENAIAALRVALPLALVYASKGGWHPMQNTRLRQLRDEIDRIAHPGPDQMREMVAAAREVLKDA